MNAVNKISYETYKTYIEHFLSKLNEELGPELISVALFGSIARGAGRPESDIDLLIVVKGDRIKNFKKYIKVKMDVEGELPPYFSSIFTTEDRLRKNPLILLDILYEGKILYDPSDNLKSLLRRLEKKLVTLGAKRKEIAQNIWFWDLKPDWKAGEVVSIEL